MQSVLLIQVTQNYGARPRLFQPEGGSKNATGADVLQWSGNIVMLQTYGLHLQ
ncbi:hypothetical protein DYY67_1432 [Candidatus Nitrosotalea sp. TS]|nr:hypothetical protein [Candidatus Nitrosotalea sp. TS]